MMDQEPEANAGWTGRLALVLTVLAAAACLGAVALAAGVTLVMRALPQGQPAAISAPPTRIPLQPGASATPATREAPNRPAGEVDLLVVQGADGNIFTVRPDGADRHMLTSDASPQHVYGQPTWSPDGASLAWSEVLAEGGRDASALYYQRLDESISNRVDTGSNAPFYVYWSPDSRQVAFLSNWERELALRRVDLDGDGRSATLMAQGQPLYFAWAPDSARFFAHIGSDRLGVYGLDGSRTPISPAPGDFSAPAWLPGDRLLYVTRTPAGQSLVLGTAEGRELKRLVSVDGQVSFVPDPAGGRVAYAVTRLLTPTNAFGPLSVVDVQSGETTEVTTEPVLAFFWSPDGRNLAYVTPEGSEPDQAGLPATISDRVQHEGVWLRWHVWDGSESRRLDRFIPSDAYLLEYLRFFDQYALSMTPWSPDSSAFVYAGSDGNGTDAVWVQPVTRSDAARAVADGVYAAWSPR